MRVNVGYSCDLEDVEEELGNFLERVGLKLNGVADQSSKLSALVAEGGYDPLEVLTRVHSIRVSLGKLDLRLEDIATIVSGLDGAKKAAAEAALNPPPEEPVEGMPEEPVEGMSEEPAAPAVSAVEALPAEDEGPRMKDPVPSSKKARKKKRGR